MFDDGFKTRYTTIPFAIYNGDYTKLPHYSEHITLHHQHSEVEILVVLEGEAILYAENESYLISEGDIVVLAPYMLHSYKIFADKPFSHHCICFDINLLGKNNLSVIGQPDSLAIQPVIPNTEPISGELSGYAINAYSACFHKNEGWELFSTGNMILFFGILKVHNKITKNDKNSSDFCKKTIEFLNNNYTEHITSKDMANALFISNSYFCRLFKENFNCCFQDYLSMYRIQKSKALLKDTNKSVSAVSADVGFNSFSYYSKMFKKYNFCTPTEYRKKSFDV